MRGGEALVFTALLLAGGCEGRSRDGAAPPAGRTGGDAEPPEPDGTEVADGAEEQAAARTPGVPLSRLLDGLEDRAPDGTLPVLDALDAPRSRSTEEVQNRHLPDQTDTVRTLTWDGLALEIYEVSASGKEIARRLEVTDPRYQTADGLKVGATRAEVEQILGPPDRTEDGDWIWDLSEALPQPLRASFEDDRVTRLTWTWPVD